MGWDDIDFDAIVSGATTVDVNSEQNFNLVLNSFGIALDERLTVITFSRGGAPTLPEIRFFVDGEIRAGSTFMKKYRELLDGYFDLWNDFDWYLRDALEDPLNAEDYLLEDIDLEVAMGINAYDLLINRADKNRVELWSADLINGLYELYKLTQVSLKTLTNTQSYSSPIYNQPMFFWGDDQRFNQSGGSLGEAFDTYAEAKANYNSNKTQSLQQLGTPFVPIIMGYNQRVFGNDEATGTDIWLFTASSGDFYTVTMKSVDLLGANLSIDIVGTGADVIANYTETKFTSGASTVYTTPETGFPFIGPNDAAIPVILPDNSSSVDETLGLRYEFYLYGTINDPAYPPIIDPSIPTNGEFNLVFNLAMHRSFLIDVNNSALEFFVEEDEEE